MPHELIPVITDNWTTCGRSRNELQPCPDNRQIEMLLEACYTASLKTEEGRRLQFSVVLYDPPPSDGTIPRRFGEIAKARPLYFTSPRLLTSPELLRLAPATDPKQVLVGVRPAPPMPGRESRLEIWGLLDAGSSWSRFETHETSRGIPPPDALRIFVSQPGSLSVFRGGDSLASLRGGRISQPVSLLTGTGAAFSFFDEARQRLYKGVLAELGKSRWDDEPDESGLTDEDFPIRFGAMVLARLLNNIARSGHGGAVLCVPSHIKTDDERLRSRVHIKYTLNDNRLSTLTSHYLVTCHKYFERHFRLWDSTQQLDVEEFHRHSIGHSMLEETEEALADAIRFTGSLAGVDGAIVINDELSLLGFGAEVTTHSSSLAEVKIEQDPTWTAGESVPIEEFGTRHRSAFRFCSSFEAGMAFVSSQDGGVKAVRRVDRDVKVWPNLVLE